MFLAAQLTASLDLLNEAAAPPDSPFATETHSDFDFIEFRLEIIVFSTVRFHPILSPRQLPPPRKKGGWNWFCVRFPSQELLESIY